MDIHLTAYVIFSLFGLSSGLVCGKQGADIVFVLDSSFSIWQRHFQKQLKFVVNVIDQFPIGKNQGDFHVAVITYSENVTVELHLKDFVDKENLKKAVMRIQRPSEGGTYTFRALKYARQRMFTTRNGGRTYSDKIIIVITDGLSQNTTATRLEAARAHYEGIQVFAIGVGGVDRQELELIASEPARSHVFTVDKFDFLDTIKRKVARQTCRVPKNHRKNDRRSDMDPSVAYKNHHKKKKCGGKPADVFFLLDSSSSIWLPDFHKQLRFVEHVIDLLNTTNGNTRIGLVTFSNQVRLVMRLGSPDNKQKIKEMLTRSDIYLTGGSTDTANAIGFVRDVGFNPKEARSGVAHIMIVITDGQSSDQQATAYHAKMAHDAGIYVFAIGVGKDTDYHELKQMASDPDVNFVFRVGAYDALESIKHILVIKTCKVADERPMRSPPALFPKRHMDVMFLVDECQFARPQLQLVKNFIAGSVNEMHVAPYWTRVGVFSSQCSTQHNDIYLAEHRTSQGFIDDFNKPVTHNMVWLMRRLRHHGFKTNNGGRGDAPHVAIVFVNEKLERLEHTVREANRARFQKIKVFVVAIGRTYSLHEVRKLADRDYYIQVRDVQSLRGHTRHFLDTILKGL